MTERTENVWVVRADSGKYVEHFVRGGFVATDAKVDATGAVDRAGIKRRYELKCPRKTPAQVGSQVGQLYTFVFRIHERDYVVTPTAGANGLRYGRVTGPLCPELANDDCPYLNRRPVVWSLACLQDPRSMKFLWKTLGCQLAVFEVRSAARDEFLQHIAALDRPPIR